MGLGGRCVALMRSARAEEKLAGLVLMHKMVDVVQERKRRERDEQKDDDMLDCEQETDGSGGEEKRQGGESEMKKEKEGQHEDVDALKRVLLEAAYRAVGLKFLIRLMLPMKDRSMHGNVNQREADAAPVCEILNSGFPLSVAILKCIAADEALHAAMCKRAVSVSNRHHREDNDADVSAADIDGGGSDDPMTVLDVIEKVIAKLTTLVVAVHDVHERGSRETATAAGGANGRHGGGAVATTTQPDDAWDAFPLSMEDHETTANYFTAILDVLEFLNSMMTQPSTVSSGGNNNAAADDDIIIITAQVLRCQFIAVAGLMTRNVIHLASKLMSSGGYTMENELERQCLSALDKCVDAMAIATQAGGGTKEEDDQAIAATLEMVMTFIGSDYADVQLGALAVMVKVLRLAESRGIGAHSVLADHGHRRRLRAVASTSNASGVDDIEKMSSDARKYHNHDDDHHQVQGDTTHGSAGAQRCISLFRKGLRRFLSAKLDEGRRHLLLEMAAVLATMDGGNFMLFGKSDMAMILTHQHSAVVESQMESGDEDADGDADWKAILGQQEEIARHRMTNGVASDGKKSRKKTKKNERAHHSRRRRRDVSGHTHVTFQNIDTNDGDDDEELLRYKESRLPVFVLLSHHLRVECEVMLHDAARPGHEGHGDKNSENKLRREAVASQVLPSIFLLFEKMTGILAESQKVDDDSDDDDDDTSSEDNEDRNERDDRARERRVSLFQCLDLPDSEMATAFTSLRNVTISILDYIGVAVEGCKDDSMKRKVRYVPDNSLSSSPRGWELVSNETMYVCVLSCAFVSICASIRTSGSYVVGRGSCNVTIRVRSPGGNDGRLCIFVIVLTASS